MKISELKKKLIEAMVDENQIASSYKKMKYEMPNDPNKFQIYNIGEQEEITTECKAYQRSALIILNFLTRWPSEILPKDLQASILELIKNMEIAKGSLDISMRLAVRKDELVANNTIYL
jgi:hypothetical protein